MSEFFMLFMKMSRTHSSSPADMLHLCAICARAPQKYSNDFLCLSLSLFLFSNLCLSSVTFVFPTNAIDRFSQNSLEQIQRILTLVKFWPNIFSPSFPRAKLSIDLSFLSASSNLMPLNFFVSDFIQAFSSSSYLFYARAFLSKRDVFCGSVSLSG